MAVPVAEAFRASYDALVRLVVAVDDEASWRPSGCRGWAVRDVAFHCLSDAQRALVALNSPTALPADRDAVSYWADWAPDERAAAQGRRFVRVAGSMFLDFSVLRDLFVDTLTAVQHAARLVPDPQPLRTQGHVLVCQDLLSTLAVEATLHHIDLLAADDQLPRPSPAGLALARHTVEGLLGQALPASWTDEHCARITTGRTDVDDHERRMLGTAAHRLPLFA